MPVWYMARIIGQSGENVADNVAEKTAHTAEAVPAWMRVAMGEHCAMGDIAAVNMDIEECHAA
ncbi:MAG: hypothetical protein LUF30_06435 [Lachnospiraceae bacterium]|nr:hypothetical protein [Lachnospiraceae bacterium]